MKNESCPCCGGPARPGLFERRPFVEEPLAVEWMRESGALLPVDDGPFIAVAGRYFIPVQLPLPIGQLYSPIRLRLWVEISESDIAGIRLVLLGERRSYSSTATMACDIPGFPGSVGSPCRFRLRGDGQEAVLTSLADERISAIPEQLDHDGYAALYRLVWGNAKTIRDFNPEGQEALASSWSKWLGRQTYAREIGPPPQMAGMNPGKVVVAPPIDTNEPAVLATLGCSDLVGAGDRHYELLCSIQNPSEEFIRCFGEFAYLTRMNTALIGPSAIIPEKGGIPDAEEMVAWLLAEPWWGEVGPDSVAGKEIDHLVAVPIYAAELTFAAIYGPEALTRVFQDIDPDLSSLQRRPVVEVENE